MTTVKPAPHGAIARHLFRQQLPGMAALVGVYAAIIAALTAGFAVFGTIDDSVWDQGVPLTRWVALGMGAYLTAVYLPLYIAHGQTRREFIGQATAYMVGFASLVAALMTLGYGLESVIFGALGWPHPLADQALLTGLADALGQSWVAYLVWTATGAMAGAGFYRRFALGAALAILGLAFLALVDASVPWAPAVRLVSFALAVGVTWMVVRDMPMRTKPA